MRRAHRRREHQIEPQQNQADETAALLAKEVVDVALAGVAYHYDCTQDQAYRLLVAAIRKVEQ